ncbi:SMC family ATPase [Candidatus Daviesbacteria bacterium]|nr:SMC family ATPase [Candidatus Daviesbacteria bacterium]
MIPVKLKLNNFTSYGESVPDLDFKKFKLAAISGPNGAGKSSLLDAITWCVWGWSRAGDSTDDLIHLGAKEMFVEFSFELDNHTFIVKRQRSLSHGGSTNLEFWSGKNNLTEGTIKATQQKIIETLHLSFETFTNSSFLRQGHADEFTTKGPSDRKRILADILGLSHYDLLEEKAREKVKEAQNKLKLLEYQLLEIEAELSQKQEREKILHEQTEKVKGIEGSIKLLEEDLKNLQKQKEIWQNLQEAQKELDAIVAQGKERAERIKNLDLRITNFAKLQQEIENLQKEKTELEDLRKKQNEKLQLQKELSDWQGGLNVKLEQKKTLQKQLDDMQDELKKLAMPGAKCPTCGQEIGKADKHKVIYDLRIKNKDLEKKLSEIKTEEEETEIKKLEKAISLISTDSEKLIKLENALKELESLQKQKEQILQDQASLETEKKTREELLVLFKHKKLQVEKLQLELKKLPQTEGDLTEKERKLEDLRAEEKQTRNLLGQATELISRSQQLEKLQKQKQTEKANLEKDKQNFEELSLAFGKKGIQAMIIETAIPEIEDEANKLLDKLTEGRMKVAFLTQREGKTTESIIETLDIIISDEMGERPYDLYSGGEAFRVNFAIRLAISKLLTRRAGARLQFLVIDEGFGTQDTQGRSRIVEVLDAIKNDFEKILIITHLDELKEEFPVRIEVSKNSSGSTFEVVGT